MTSTNGEPVNYTKSACAVLFSSIQEVYDKIKDYFKNLNLNNLNELKKMIMKLDDCKKYEANETLIKIFYKNNYIGPFDKDDVIYEIFDLTLEESIQVNQYLSIQLSIDGEDIRSVIKHPLFLWLGTLFIDFTTIKINSLLSTLSLYILWAQLFDQTLSHFKEKCDKLTNQIFEIISNHPDFDEHLKNTALLQCLQSSLMFKDYETSKKLIKFLTDRFNIEMTMTGILGKRTKYQIKDLAQLVLNVKVNSTTISEDVTVCLPQDVTLDDDTLLPHISLNTQLDIPILDEFQQSLLILICYFKLNNYPSHELVNEELLPYIDIVLNRPNNYLIGRYALFLRCQIECHSTRKTERSITQMESLINEFLFQEANVKDKIENWKLMIPVSYWKLKESLAQILMKMGCFNSAIDHLNDTKSFSELLSCYIACGRREKAEAIINQEIERIGKTPYLLCLLGQIKDEIEYYHEAWKLSTGKSFRSQLQLGFHYLQEKKYACCIEHFERALEINTIQPHIWYNLGCAYLHENNINCAIKAFRTCCNLSPDHFKAWTNLASLLEYKENYPAAYSAITSAISSHYDHPQAWIKFAQISIKIGKPNDVLRAIQRLSDLNPSSVNEDMIGYLVKHTTETHNDKSESIKLQLRTTLGKIAAKTELHYRVWFLYSKLYDQTNEIDILKICDYLNRALRELVFHNRQWLTDSSVAIETVDIAHSLVDNFKFWAGILDKNMLKNILSSTVLTLSNTVSHFQTVLSDVKDDMLAAAIKKASEELDILKSNIIVEYNIN